MRRQDPRKIGAGEIVELALALEGEGVESGELGVGMSGMAHHQPVLRQPFKKGREQRGEIEAGVEIVSAGERRIDAHTGRGGQLHETAAETVEEGGLAIAASARIW